MQQRQAVAVVAWLINLLLGLILCIAVALSCLGLEQLERRAFDHSYVEALVLAILLGMAIRSFWPPGVLLGRGLPSARGNCSMLRCDARRRDRAHRRGLVSAQIGTLVKLIRVLMLGPVVIALSIFAPRWLGTKTVEARKRRMACFRFVPWFIIGFALLSASRSPAIVPAEVAQPIAKLTLFLTIISMAALGSASTSGSWPKLADA